MEQESIFRCPVYKKCGGCQLDVEYPRQLGYKQRLVGKLLGRYGRIEPIVGMKEPLHYRCKVSTAFGFSQGHAISGVWQSSSGKIVKVNNCGLENEQAQRIMGVIRRLVPQFRIKTYDERSGKGFLRFVTIRIGKQSGEILVAFGVGKGAFPSKQDFIRELVRLCPEITSIVQCVSLGLNLLLGKQEEVLYGTGYITDYLCGRSFRISARSFFQVNPVQTETLYATAVDFAELSPDDRVLDAYCGVGTIGILAASGAKEVIAVESNGDAVKNARENAKLNAIENMRVFKADAGDFMRGMAREGERADVVFTDPPRAGCSREFLSALCRMRPKKIVYISCNPETQARDLAYLTKNGYKVRRIRPVDMFPFTRHIETVALLSRQKVTEHIYIDVNIADLPKTTRTTATYPEIKAYIKDKYGLCVSSLNIAQIKEKHGFEKRENYNKGKEGHRVPKCPPEKEKAIEDAFKHFGML